MSHRLLSPAAQDLWQPPFYFHFISLTLKKTEFSKTSHLAPTPLIEFVDVTSKQANKLHKNLSWLTKCWVVWPGSIA